MSGNVTEYIGKDYPVMSYGSQQSLSGSAVSKDRLIAERDQLLLIRADIYTQWDTLVDAYYHSVTDSYESESAGSHPPSGTTVTKGVLKMDGKFGGFQCWVLIIDNDTLVEEWHRWGPSNLTVMSINGPEPKPMLMSADAGIHVMVGTGDTTYLAGGLFTGLRKFGGDACLIGFEECTYDSEFDETLMPGTYEGELDGLIYAIQINCEDGSPAVGSDLQKYVDDMRFIDEHIYGMPSKEGTQGVVPRVNSITLGNEVTTNNVYKFNAINDFYRGDNLLGVNYTTWSGFVSASNTDIKYVNTSGGEWINSDSPSLLDQFKIAIEGDLTSQIPSGTQFLLDMTIGTSACHRYTVSEEALYHTPEMATYCETILSPDIMTTVNLKAVTASNNFEDLLLDTDLESLSISGGSTYTNLLYVNKLTIRIASVSSTTLPASGSITPIIATHTSGLVNYFTIFKSTDGIDPFAGYTVIKFNDGLPIEYRIDVINKET